MFPRGGDYLRLGCVVQGAGWPGRPKLNIGLCGSVLQGWPHLVLAVTPFRMKWPAARGWPKPPRCESWRPQPRCEFPGTRSAPGAPSRWCHWTFHRAPGHDHDSTAPLTPAVIGHPPTTASFALKTSTPGARLTWSGQKAKARQVHAHHPARVSWSRGSPSGAHRDSGSAGAACRYANTLAVRS
jgi:hypothetical protein